MNDGRVSFFVDVKALMPFAIVEDKKNKGSVRLWILDAMTNKNMQMKSSFTKKRRRRKRQVLRSSSQNSRQRSPSLILKKDTDDQSDLTNKETAAALEDARETRAAKEKRRKASWLSPILGGIIGGGLVLGISPYLPGDHPSETAGTGQTEPKQSQNFTTKPVTNADNVPDMVEDLEPAIVGVSNIQTSLRLL